MSSTDASGAADMDPVISCIHTAQTCINDLPSVPCRFSSRPSESEVEGADSLFAALLRLPLSVFLPSIGLSFSSLAPASEGVHYAVISIHIIIVIQF